MVYYQERQGGNLQITSAIIIAGVIISGVFIFAGRSNSQVDVTNNLPTPLTSNSFRGSESSEHVLGNLEAEVSIIEFSDFECPFCSKLHPTLAQIVEDFPDDVNWVYRHLPIADHTRAMGAAIASECIARLAGNDAFWDFADTAFTNQRNLGYSLYNEVAISNGINIDEFSACLDDQTIVDEITRDRDEARNLGGNATPFVVVITSNGELIPFSGALPYESIKSIVEHALQS